MNTSGEQCELRWYKSTKPFGVTTLSLPAQLRIRLTFFSWCHLLASVWALHGLPAQLMAELRVWLPPGALKLGYPPGHPEWRSQWAVLLDDRLLGRWRLAG